MWQCGAWSYFWFAHNSRYIVRGSWSATPLPSLLEGGRRSINKMSTSYSLSLSLSSSSSSSSLFFPLLAGRYSYKERRTSLSLSSSLFFFPLLAGRCTNKERWTSLSLFFFFLSSLPVVVGLRPRRRGVCIGKIGRLGFIVFPIHPHTHGAGCWAEARQRTAAAL